MTKILPRTLPGLVGAVALISGLITLALWAMTQQIVKWELETQLQNRLQVEMNDLLGGRHGADFEALRQTIIQRSQAGFPGNAHNAGGASTAPASPSSPGLKTAEADEHQTSGPNSADRADQAISYMLVDAQGQQQAGTLAIDLPAPGWSTMKEFTRPSGTVGEARLLTVALKTGGHLVIAADRAIIQRMQMRLLQIFSLGFGVLTLLNTLIIISFGRIIGHRQHAIAQTAEAVTAGDLTRRMPLSGVNDGGERLAIIINSMLDRLTTALENLRQVSTDIAHDLRTPLQRVRARLEQAAQKASDPAMEEEINSALDEVDDLLGLFSSILAISEIEGEAIGQRMVTLDWYGVADTVVELYAPTVEDSGRGISLSGEPVFVRGDKRLLQQMLANLLDNALVHTAKGTHIAVELSRSGDHAVMSVSDNGKGIPQEDHERVFRRLFRVDSSRSKPGHGLGLNMVAAIAHAHSGSVTIDPNASGARFVFTLPLAKTA